MEFAFENFNLPTKYTKLYSFLFACFVGNMLLNHRGTELNTIV